MKNKHVVITGASSGLGEALAKQFASRGANLTLAARRSDRLEQMQKDLLNHFPHITVAIAPCDVGEKRSCQQLIEKSIGQFSRIDVFVANAGVGMWSKLKDVSDPDELQQLMQVNYMGVVYGLYYALPHLRASLGSFVAISSIQGLIPVPYHTGYVASKFAVNGLIETVRLEEKAVHFLLALPSWIAGTELRTHALSGVGKEAIKVKTHHKKNIISADDCAALIVDALMAKKLEIFIPKKYRWLPFLRGVAKQAFDRVVMKKVNTQLIGK